MAGDRGLADIALLENVAQGEVVTTMYMCLLRASGMLRSTVTSLACILVLVWDELQM